MHSYDRDLDEKGKRNTQEKEEIEREKGQPVGKKPTPVPPGIKESPKKTHRKGS